MRGRAKWGAPAAAALLLGCGLVVLGPGVKPAHAAPGVNLVQAWAITLPGETIRQSSPVLTSYGVAVGTLAGNLHVLNTTNGAELPGWPAHDSHPINGSPAADTLPGQTAETLFIGTGEAASTPAGECSGGGLWARLPSGAALWHEELTDPNCASLPFQSSFMVAPITNGGQVSGSIGALGLLFFSVAAASGRVNPGFPYYANDTQFATPALTTINGAPAIIEGIDSSSTHGGAVVALNGAGQVIWNFPTKEVVHSSPAIGVDANGASYITFGTGDYFATHGGSPDSDTLFNIDLAGHQRWRQDLGGITMASPAIADVTGSGVPDIIEATNGVGANPNAGTVSVLDPVTGNFLPGWKEVGVPGGAVIGSPTTADFGSGYQDILVPTGGGIDILDGRSARLIAEVDAGIASFQNSPLVLTDAAGFATGMLIAGSEANGTGLVQRFNVAGAGSASTGAARATASVGWHMFHHDPQHTGNAGAAGQVAGCVAGPSTPAPSGKVNRLAGDNRDGTAIAVSMSSFPAVGSAHTVVIASDANYPDALAGGPLAAATHGPLLITPPGGLPPPVLAEIRRVLPPGSTVYVLGGSSAVSPTVDAQLAGYSVTRLAGPDRFGTAVTIAGALGDPSTTFEVTGLAFPDGLAAGPAAANAGGAILLTDGSAEAPATADYVDAHPGAHYAVGGPAAAADPAATPIAGPDRDGTALDVGARFFAAPSRAGFAVDATFPDALSGGPWLGRGGPLLLVPPCGALPSGVLSYLSAVKGSVGVAALFGGPNAVGDDVLSALEKALA